MMLISVSVSANVGSFSRCLDDMQVVTSMKLDVVRRRYTPQGAAAVHVTGGRGRPRHRLGAAALGAIAGSVVWSAHSTRYRCSWRQHSYRSTSTITNFF